MSKDMEKQNEIKQDDATRFLIKRYVSEGYHLHFHRNLEIYGVIQGRVVVTIDGQQSILTDGQIAIADSMENHSYEIDGEAEVFYFHIGTRYLSNLHSIYPQKRLPHWLMDAQYNQKLCEQILPLIGETERISELRRIGIVCRLFSDIIEHYGTIEKVGNNRADEDVVTRVVQYIYDHYQENITLETLSKQFYLSSKALSKKLKKHINMDLRIFINDIRVQRVVEMLDDPKNHGKSINQIAAQCGFSSMATFYRSYERNYSFRKLEE